MADTPPAAGKSSFDLIDKERFFSLFDLSPGSTVLDLACGAGRYSIALSKVPVTAYKIYAIDLWAKGIEALNSVIAKDHIPNMHTINADISKKIPLATAFADACLLATVLHDLSPAAQEGTLGEIQRVLKPGGTLMIIEFKKIDNGPGPPVNIRLDEREVDAIAGRYAFSRVSYDEIGPFNYLMKFRRTA